MSIAANFDRSLEILRNAPASPPAVDEWNQPATTADVVTATVDGMLQTLTLREVGLLTDAGAVIGDYRAFVDAYRVQADGTQAAVDIRSADRIRDVASATTYEVRAVMPTGPIDIDGQPHHYELLLHRFTD